MTMTTTPLRRQRLDSGEPLSPIHTPSNHPSIDEDDDSPKEKKPRLFLRANSFHECPNRIPCINRLPPRLRLFLFLTWLVWKATITILFLRLLWAGANATPPWRNHFPFIGGGMTLVNDSLTSHYHQPTRILYIVTALAEYNNGKRSTVKGQDRLGEVLVPVLVDSVNSLVSYDYKVDVFLVLGYKLRPERRAMIQSRLPSGVGLEVWDEATPLSYPDGGSRDTAKMELNTRALARQHRFVIRDKLHQYDLFCAWEDDIRITGEHVRHFISMSTELKRLYKQAPEEVEGVPEDMNPKRQRFFGQMTKRQMKRLIPGFVRVEVLVDNGDTGRALDAIESPIPLDHDFDDGDESHFDASICCHVPELQPNNGIPKLPSLRDAVVWETNVTALSLRQLPGSSDWVVLLPGPGKMLEKEDLIGGYWTGRDGAFGENYDKPSPGMPNLFAQQGGWMATRDQIVQLNSGQCHGSFLPPFGNDDNDVVMKQDGMAMKNVEFWSGGYQLFTGVRGGCNMQRVVSFHPANFSKHFIYHTANNKQKQLSKGRLIRADDLFGQLNSIRKAAEGTKAEMLKR